MTNKSDKKNVNHLNIDVFGNIGCCFAEKGCPKYIFKCRYSVLYRSKL